MVEFYAHWAINNYTITFDFGNGTNTSTEFKYNETIIYPENITREGYTFNEWDPKPETMPVNDTTVVTQWTVNNYTIIFDANRGSPAYPLTLPYNEPIKNPPNPTRDEFTFSGWFTNKDLTIPFSTTHMPAHDITLYAKWNSTDIWTPLKSISNVSELSTLQGL